MHNIDISAAISSLQATDRGNNAHLNGGPQRYSCCLEQLLEALSQCTYSISGYHFMSDCITMPGPPSYKHTKQDALSTCHHFRMITAWAMTVLACFSEATKRSHSDSMTEDMRVMCESSLETSGMMLSVRGVEIAWELDEKWPTRCTSTVSSTCKKNVVTAQQSDLQDLFT